MTSLGIQLPRNDFDNTKKLFDLSDLNLNSYTSHQYDVKLAPTVLDSDHRGFILLLPFPSDKISPVERVSKRLPIGIPVDNTIFAAATHTPPMRSEFSFTPADLCPAPPPDETHLTAPTPAVPPDGDYYPLAPHSGYELMADARYKRGYVYVADYNISEENVQAHGKLLEKVATPPNVEPDFIGGSFVASPIPGMVQMIPGIPFAFSYHGDHDRLHTVACAQTLESLSHYSDYPDILRDSVKLAKLTWGCPAHGETPEIAPIYELPGMKENDRSAKRTDFHEHVHDGSYNLANTVMKGEGLGTFLPAVQANTPTAMSQITAVLTILHSLFRLIMPKCLSKFEQEVTDFHSEFNNVITFGGLAPGGVGAQMNVSALGAILAFFIGRVQGGWHSDVSDNICRWTLFVLLLRVGPDGDPGPFCLARSGLYIRAKNVWIVFLVFKGSDLHSGFAPKEDPQAHKRWVEENLSAAWNVAGPQNRVGYVSYIGGIPSDRLGSMNITPPTLFGNYGSSQVHKNKQKTFAMHGHNILGGTPAYAERMGREIIADFWNSLQFCDLDLDQDLNELMSKISFKDPQTNSPVKLGPLPLNPQSDRKVIERYLKLYAWHKREAALFHVNIPKARLLANKNKRAQSGGSKMVQDVNLWSYRRQPPPEPDVGTEVAPLQPLHIEKVLGKTVKGDKLYYTIQVEGEESTVQIEEDSPQIKGNAILLNYMKSDMLSRVPDHPALGLLSSNSPDSLALEQISTHTIGGRADAEQTTDGCVASTINPSASNVAAQSKEGKLPRITKPLPKPKDKPTSKLSKSKDKPAPKLPNPGNTPAPKNLNKTPQKAKSDHESICSQPQPGAENPARPEKRKTRNSDHSDSYEVEDIFGHRQDDQGNWMWEIKWKGYNETQWTKEQDLDGCIEILADYNAKHGIHPNDITGPKKKPRLAIVSGAVTLAHNLTNLSNLLSPTALNQEVVYLEQAYGASKSKDFYRSDNTGSMVQLWAAQQYRNSFLNGILALLPKDSMLAPAIQFQLVQNVTEVIPKMEADIQKMDIIKRSFRYETCCALVKVFEWYSDVGPTTSETLMQIHRTHGYLYLLGEAPQFAKLVDHIVQYVYRLSVLKYNESAVKISVGKRNKKTTPLVEQVVYQPDFGLILEQDLEKISRIPANFYGLRNSTSQMRVKLPPIKDKDLGYGSDALYSAASYCLQELWSAEIIIPKLRKLDESLSGGKIKNFDSQHVYQRSITRAAILWCIADACGTNGIFASSRMDQFLQSPAIIFEHPLSRERKFAPEVLKQRDIVLQPLFNWIRSHLAEHSTVAADAKQLSKLADLQILELFLGKRISDSDDDPSVQTLTSGRSTKKGINNVAPVLKPVTFEVVVGPKHKDGIALGELALIIREALNRERGHQPADEILNRVLNGYHATTSTSTRSNPDHTNPIRQNLEAASLLQTHLPGELLTSRYGLSNLLSWMGTGQGFKTRSFLESFTHDRQFFSSNLEEMIQIFQAVVAQNALIVSRYPEHPRPQDLPGVIAVDDMLVWGQPNHLLSSAPTKEKIGSYAIKYTLREKFALYWTKEVQNAWVAFLGDMVDQDPMTYTGPRRAWRDVRSLLENLNVTGFGSGLTPFQLANHLVALKIVDSPSVIDIADWIHKHPKLGAFRGLEDLGFSISKKNLMSVRGAFTCIYRFFDEHLTEPDKSLLFFGPILTEHILCKIPRWKTRLADEDAEGRLEELAAKEIEKNYLWISGGNIICNKAFPVPLIIPPAWLKQTIESVSVQSSI